MKILFKKMHLLAIKPDYAHCGDSGMDLYSTETTELFPGDIKKIDSGIAVELPLGKEIQVRPKSGLSAKGIICIFGTVDSTYRGSIQVIRMPP